MTKFKLKQSATVLNILIALVVTLVVNFSYLLSVMVEQRETSEQQKLRNERPFFVKPHRKGVLRISRDGYGYLICERHFSPEEGVDSVRTDSVYATNRKIRWYNLHDGDSLVCTIFPSKGDSNPVMDEVLMQNGNEITAPMIYDRPKRNQDMAVQLLYYFVLSFLLMTIITARVGKDNYSTKSYLQRCALALVAAFVCYFFAPFIEWQTGRVLMIFQNKHMPLDLIVILKCTVVLVVAVLYGRIYGLMSQQQQILLENERLRNENLQTRYDMLMGQISPHFFFNSLNSLYALIRCNPDQAREFTLTLSRVYRRVLERRKQILSTLAEEIDFTWQYYTLQKIRFDDRIELTSAIDPALRNWRIPSMSLQTLVENAVKHNSITGGNPLHIRIRTEGESFLIENNYTPRSDGDKESLGMGLERIRSVYRFYTEENISISVGDGTFRCRLPLLPPEK